MAKHYTDLRIPVYNFYEALKGNFKFLWIDEIGEEDLTDVWSSIYTMYCKEANVDNRYLKLYVKIERLKLKHQDIFILLHLAQDHYPEVRKRAAEVLKTKHQYFIRPHIPLKDEIKRLEKGLNSLATKIQIEEAKLPKENKKEAVNLMDQVIGIENIFPGRSIDIYTMSMEKWIALSASANEKVKFQNAALNKTRR